jgi:competence protein ComEC
LALGEVFSYFPVTLALLLFLSLLLDRRFHGELLPTFFLFCGGAGLWVHQLVSIPFTTGDLRQYIDQGEIDIVAQVDRPPQHFARQLLFQMEGVEMYADSVQSVHGSFRLTIYNADAPLEYGDRLRMRIRLRRPQQLGTPGAFQYADYREREGWSGVATLSNLDQVRKVGEGGNPILRLLYRWREQIRQKILTSLDGAPAALLLALIIGETGYLTDPIREVFSASGTTHILSISGSHLALISILIFGAVRWLLLRLSAPLLLRLSLWKVPSQWAALVTAGPVAFYALLAGGEIATLRSLVMIWVYLFSIWIGRSGEVRTTLSLAALLIVAFHPQAIFDLSFQLSFLSVLMITLTFSWWKATFPTAPPEKKRSRYHAYLIEPGRRMVLSTLGATLGTAPLTLFYFHQFSWIGLLANLILIPLAGWVIVPFGLLSALLSLFGGETFPLAGWHQRLGSLYYRLTEFFAHFPGADLHAAAPPLWIIVLFYGVMIWMLSRGVSWKWIASTVAAFFIVFLGVGSFRFPPERLRVSFIDVAQGDATLIEFPHGKTMLIDGGAGGAFNAGRLAVAPYLWERGIRTIDYLVGTHPQMDHIGGLPYIIQKFNIKEIWTNGQSRDLPFYYAFSEAVEAKGLRPKVVSSDTPPMEIDGCRLFSLNPPGRSRFEEELNNQSIVLRLVCPDLGGGGFSLLLTGDIEQGAEQRLLRSESDLKSTVLKVPHHGSISSLDSLFLSAVSPQVALFSVGRNNPYRHPHPKVLAAYQALPADVYRTDHHGAVTIEADATGWRLKAYRENKLEKIRWQTSLPAQEWENLKRAFSRF